MRVFMEICSVFGTDTVFPFTFMVGVSIFSVGFGIEVDGVGIEVDGVFTCVEVDGVCTCVCVEVVVVVFGVVSVCVEVVCGCIFVFVSVEVICVWVAPSLVVIDVGSVCVSPSTVFAKGVCVSAVIVGGGSVFVILLAENNKRGITCCGLVSCLDCAVGGVCVSAESIPSIEDDLTLLFSKGELGELLPVEEVSVSAAVDPVPGVVCFVGVVFGVICFCSSSNLRFLGVLGGLMII